MSSLICLTSLAYIIVFMAHPYYCNSSILFYCRISSYYMAILLYILLIHSSFDGHLDDFQFFATMRVAAVNVSVQVFVWAHVFISLGLCQGGGLLGCKCVELC